MAFVSAFDRVEDYRPVLNVGGLLDIPTGHYITGPNGESILLGGLSTLTGIGGRGNTFKTTIMLFMFLRAMDRYRGEGMVYDTEMTLSHNRIQQIADEVFENLTIDDVSPTSPNFVLTDKTKYSGNQIFDLVKAQLKDHKNDKDVKVTFPVRDTEGNKIRVPLPVLWAIDSFSQFSTESQEKLQEGDIGSSSRNIEAARDGMAKNQFIMELPGVLAKNGAFGFLSAHVGDEVQIDAFDPPSKKLAHMKQGIKFKNVPEKFTFLTNNCWYAYKSEPLVNNNTKGPEFPRDGDDNMKNDPDLMVVYLTTVRGKGGMSGFTLPMVVSQKEGMLPSLSEFYYIKAMERFGLGGNQQRYHLELYPEVTMQRTTVRSKINEDPKIRRALEITSELCQMKHLWIGEEDHDLVCEPGVLYEDLKKAGYDWDILLDTRGYWVFEEQQKQQSKPFLSTKDLLRMRRGEYHPYWYDKRKSK